MISWLLLNSQRMWIRRRTRSVVKVDVSKNAFLPVWVRLTRLGQVIRLLVGDTRRPPPWLCQLRVNTLRCSSNILPSIIRVVDLLARLNQLDPCLGNHSAVELLEVVERLLVVPSQDVVISHTQRGAADGGTRGG